MGDNTEMGVGGATRRDWSPEDGTPAAPSADKTPTDASLRAASYAGFEAWIRGEQDFDAEGTDPNPGPPGAVARTAVPFLREDHDVSDISQTDVRQGGLGDCSLCAALMGLALTPEGRARIHGAIQTHTDASGRVTGYSVTLYERQVHIFRRDTFTPRSIDLPAGEPYAKDHAVAKGDATRDEIWPLLIEKAYASLRGSYTRIGNGIDPARVLETLTGRASWQVAPAKVNDVSLATALAVHQVVILSSRGDLPDTKGVPNKDPNNVLGIAPHHAYVVRSVTGSGDDAAVVLANPWGDNDPEPIPIRELAKWFTAVSGACP